MAVRFITGATGMAGAPYRDDDLTDYEALFDPLNEVRRNDYVRYYVTNGQTGERVLKPGGVVVFVAPLEGEIDAALITLKSLRPSPTTREHIFWKVIAQSPESLCDTANLRARPRHYSSSGKVLERVEMLRRVSDRDAIRALQAQLDDLIQALKAQKIRTTLH